PRSLGAELPTLTAGHVDTGFSVVSTLGGPIRAGKLRGLAVAGPRRLAALPGIPTMAEAGMPGMEATVWNGLFAPAGTPQPVIVLLQQQIAKALNAPDVREQIVASGAELGGRTPEEFSEFVRAGVVKWGKVIKEAGVKLD